VTVNTAVEPVVQFVIIQVIARDVKVRANACTAMLPVYARIAMVLRPVGFAVVPGKHWRYR
jgi:hypothetical protein